MFDNPRLYWKALEQLKGIDDVGDQDSNPIPGDFWVKHYSSLLKPDINTERDQGPVSQTILSPLVTLSMGKTMVAKVISELKSISRHFSRNWPQQVTLQLQRLEMQDEFNELSYIITYKEVITAIGELKKRQVTWA